MNQAEKEQYLREYAVLKSKGKPFFPYAVAKDSIMAAFVVLLIAFLSILFGAELGPKADPTTTTYVPRPEWYFFFLFELLRVIKPPDLTPLATIGIPTICMILLVLLPFYDRGPERRPERRPIATAAGWYSAGSDARKKKRRNSSSAGSSPRASPRRSVKAKPRGLPQTSPSFLEPAKRTISGRLRGSSRSLGPRFAPISSSRNSAQTPTTAIRLRIWL
jgi:hypothetical protein